MPTSIDIKKEQEILSLSQQLKKKYKIIIQNKHKITNSMIINFNKHSITKRYDIMSLYLYKNKSKGSIHSEL